MDYEKIQLIRADDAKWFELHPDREFLCRRMHDAEMSGEPPQGLWGFAIIHRHDAERYWNHVNFGAELWFDTTLTDAQCREKIREQVAKEKALRAAKVRQ